MNRPEMALFVHIDPAQEQTTSPSENKPEQYSGRGYVALSLVSCGTL